MLVKNRRDGEEPSATSERRALRKTILEQAKQLNGVGGGITTRAPLRSTAEAPPWLYGAPPSQNAPYASQYGAPRARYVYPPLQQAAPPSQYRRAGYNVPEHLMISDSSRPD